MKTKELIDEIEKLFSQPIGMQMYAVIKTDNTNEIKLVNIRDDNGEQTDQTEDELMNGFINIMCNKFEKYREDEPILPLSSADERTNGLFIYDLEELPLEMDYLKKLDSISVNTPIFSIKDDGLDKIGAFIVVIGNAERRLATVYKGNIIKNLIMDCQSYTKYRPNETTGGIFVSWRRKEELPTGA